MLTTDQKGAFAELAIAKAAFAEGIGVWHPFGDERCDFIFDLRPELMRVQCKWAVLHRDVVIARCYRARRNSAGCVRRLYTRDEVDAFALYCHDNDTCYLLPFEEVTPCGQAHLRIGAARNNQRVGVRWAKDFELAATLLRLGAVAQLGERRHGMAEATGSSPVGSISKAVFPEAALF